MAKKHELSKEERERIARRRSDEIMEHRRQRWLEKLEQNRTNRRTPPGMADYPDEEEA